MIHSEEMQHYPDVVINDDLTFSVSAFQRVIKDRLPTPFTFKGDGRDWWNEVISEASKRRVTGISPDQKPYLAAWIKSNWFWFTESWSKREQMSLRARLVELTGPDTDS